MNIFQKIAGVFNQQGNLAKLIIINVALFLTVNLGYHLMHIDLLPYLALQVGGTGFILKFWTMFTYMFIHLAPLELFFNMLLLYFAAQVFFIIMGEKKLIYVYIMSGLCGAALILILGLLVPGSFFNTSLLGASSSVLGVIMVMAAYSPNYKVNLFGVFEMSYKYFALLIFVLSTLIDFSFNTGGKISHLGGVIFGLTYGYYLKKGVDLFNISFFTRKKSHLKVVSYNKAKDEAFIERRINEETAMDELLDKISKSGYDSLTKKEKDLLFKLSQKK
ncbi:MAG: rhomboid family intramembrane serine protease [Bacteroidota bacterium]